MKSGLAQVYKEVRSQPGHREGFWASKEEQAILDYEKVKSLPGHGEGP